MVPVILELWGMRSTPLLPLLPGPLCLGAGTPDRILSIAQIELNSVLMQNWIVWNKTVFWHWNCLLMQNWIVWNRNVYTNKNGFNLNNQQWLMCHKTKPNQTKPSYYSKGTPSGFLFDKKMIIVKINIK